MKPYTPLIGSAISLIIGGVLLFNIVPFFLTIGTITGVLLLLLASYLIYKNKKSGYYLGLLLSILEIIVSASSPTHVKALLDFGSSIFISVLDILMVLGFYVFPVIYIILFAKRLIR